MILQSKISMSYLGARQGTPFKLLFQINSTEYSAQADQGIFSSKTQTLVKGHEESLERNGP